MPAESAIASLHLTRRHWLLHSAAAACGLALTSTRALADPDLGIHKADAIHQEVSFNTSARRLYATLTDATLFQKVELLSAAMTSLDLNAHPAIIHPEPGGSFSLFGGYISGRQLELVPDRLIVQAWRSQSWAPTLYSIARFELVEHDATTKLVFDHTGIPAGTAGHLASGWYANYWEPLKKYFA